MSVRGSHVATQDVSSVETEERFEPLLDSEEAAAWSYQLPDVGEEAAALLRIHPKTLQRLARAGEITGIQIGRLWRFRVSALNRWLHRIAS